MKNSNESERSSIVGAYSGIVYCALMARGSNNMVIRIISLYRIVMFSLFMVWLQAKPISECKVTIFFSNSSYVLCFLFLRLLRLFFDVRRVILSFAAGDGEP